MPSREPYRVVSTIDELVRFTKGSLWQDQANVIDYHIEHFRDQLEETFEERGEGAESDDILRGRLRMLRDLRGMPKALALSRKMQEEEEQDNAEVEEQQEELLEEIEDV